MKRYLNAPTLLIGTMVGVGFTLVTNLLSFLLNHSIWALLAAGAVTIGAGLAAAYGIRYRQGTADAGRAAATIAGLIIGIINGIALMIETYTVIMGADFHAAMNRNASTSPPGR